MPPALVARGLTKRYKNLTAVAGIDLQLERGECLALLGPNGAGKTTTVEMLEGLLAPDAGNIEILGHTLHGQRQAIMEKIGVLLQETNLYRRYTVRETLTLFASFYRQSLNVDALIERLQLTDKADVQLRRLSGGQRQRTYLGCCLINDPALLFLDEPTTGLDPQARRATWDLLASLKAEGKSLLLTTHYMDEAEVLADRVAVIDRGRVIASGTPRQLISEHCGEQILDVAFTAQKAGGGDETSDLNAWKAALTARLPWFADARIVNDGFEVTVPDAARQVQEVFAAVASLGLKLRRLELRRSTLEDVFLKLTGRSMRDA